MLLEDPGAWGGAQQGPRVGVDRAWGEALSLVKAGESQACPLVWKGGPGGLQCPGAQAIRGNAWPGHPRIVSDSQNSAGGGCDQGISRAGHCQVRVAPNPLLLGTRNGSLTEGGGSGSVQAHLSKELVAFTLKVDLFGQFGRTEGNLLVEPLPELPRLVLQGWHRGNPCCWDPGEAGRGSSTASQASGHSLRQGIILSANPLPGVWLSI